MALTATVIEQPGVRESAAERLAVELLRLAAHEQVTQHEHRHAQESVLVHEVADDVGVRERRAEAQDAVARLHEAPARAACQRQSRLAVHRLLFDNAVLVFDATSREILSRLGAGGSAVLVVEDGHRASRSRVSYRVPERGGTPHPRAGRRTYQGSPVSTSALALWRSPSVAARQSSRRSRSGR